MPAEAAAALSGNKGQVVAALRRAADATGADFQYLLETATRESGLKTHAKSATSSASGLFQFIDQTWLGLVKKYGAQYGLGAYADAISQGPDGRYRADSLADRQAILALRNDPSTAALMAGHYAADTRSALQCSLGRDVNNGELYAAHFLGPEAACRLIRLNATQPDASAASVFPQAASANRGVFYHADGTPKSVREVYAWATRQAPGDHGPAHKTRLASTPSLRGSIDDVGTPSSQLLSMILLNRNDDISTLAAFGDVPRHQVALTLDVLNVLSSLRSEEDGRKSS